MNGLEAAVMFVLAVLTACIFMRRKDRDALVVSLIALVMVPVSLLGNSYLLVTLPITWAFVAVMVVMVRRARKHT